MKSDTGYTRDPKSKKDWQWKKVKGPTPADLPGWSSLESALGPVFDQGKTHQCVCFAAAGLKRYQEWEQAGQWLNFDPNELYDQCKRVDEVPDQQGTFVRVAMDVLRKQGMRAQPTNLDYTIKAAARLSTVAEIRHSLIESGPVILGIYLDMTAFGNLGRAEQAIIDVDTKPNGGHCMLIVGHDDARQVFRVRNSYGPRWGDYGHCWLPYDYLTKTDPKFDAWTTVDA